MMEDKKDSNPKEMLAMKDIDILFQPIVSENGSPEFVEEGLQIIDNIFSGIDMDNISSEELDLLIENMKHETVSTKKLNQQVFIKHREKYKMEEHLLRHLTVTIMQQHLFRLNRFDLHNGDRIVKAMEHIRYLGCTHVRKHPQTRDVVRFCSHLMTIPSCFEHMRHYSADEREVMRTWCEKELVVMFHNITRTYDDACVQLMRAAISRFVIAFPRHPYRFRVLGELLYHRARVSLFLRHLDTSKRMYELAERGFRSAEDFTSEVSRNHAVERCRKKVNYIKMVKMMHKKKTEKASKEALEKHKEERRRNRKKDSKYVYMGGDVNGHGPRMRFKLEDSDSG